MTSKAIFAAGCFWGVEHSFRQIPGVLDVAVGYSGGAAPNPTYEQVCTGRTGHAEAVLVEFDPAVVSYESLVRHFFSMHDPTTLNHQGPDRGSQYRSAIFHFDDAQKAVAESVRRELDGSRQFPRPIVTEIVPAGRFWRAEEYHQRYFEKNGIQGCHI
jgi:peptide-methionine (S)-S-oxide reductase